jgi:hypothetical protein
MSANPYLVDSAAPSAYGRTVWKGVFVLSIACLAVFGSYCIRAASGPDETLIFERDVESDLAPKVLLERFSSVPEWSKWFYSTENAQIIDRSSHPVPNPEQVAASGAMVRIMVDPKKGEHRKFEIIAKIREFVPGKVLDMQVLDDSKGMLFRQFDSIEWRIELRPDGANTLIHGVETAHTSSWRSRLFGKIAKRILMHQIFYPDLIKLGESHPPVNPSDDQ